MSDGPGHSSAVSDFAQRCSCVYTFTDAFCDSVYHCPVSTAKCYAINEGVFVMFFFLCHFLWRNTISRIKLGLCSAAVAFTLRLTAITQPWHWLAIFPVKHVVKKCRAFWRRVRTAKWSCTYVFIVIYLNRFCPLWPRLWYLTGTEMLVETLLKA